MFIKERSILYNPEEEKSQELLKKTILKSVSNPVVYAMVSLKE